MIVFVIPVAALVLALVWVKWARKPEKPMDPIRQVEAFHRSMSAFGAEPHEQRRVAPRHHGRRDNPSA